MGLKISPSMTNLTSVMCMQADVKPDGMKRVKRERADIPGFVTANKRMRCRPAGKMAGSVTSGSSIQSLLTAASLLEGEGQGEGQEHNQLWNADKR